MWCSVDCSRVRCHVWWLRQCFSVSLSFRQYSCNARLTVSPLLSLSPLFSSPLHVQPIRTQISQVYIFLASSFPSLSGQMFYLSGVKSRPLRFVIRSTARVTSGLSSVHRPMPRQGQGRNWPYTVIPHALSSDRRPTDLTSSFSPLVARFT